ncbi:unannotated protein [freshwater metagenome]|uniref:Unannotated protein n=1 Tax=freshwater metagenome TaxID=449393 RepID=A0A6J7BWS2_9ZZZZ
MPGRAAWTCPDIPADGQLPHRHRLHGTRGRHLGRHHEPRVHPSGRLVWCDVRRIPGQPAVPAIGQRDRRTAGVRGPVGSRAQTHHGVARGAAAFGSLCSRPPGLTSRRTSPCHRRGDGAVRLRHLLWNLRRKHLVGDPRRVRVLLGSAVRVAHPRLCRSPAAHRTRTSPHHPAGGSSCVESSGDSRLGAGRGTRPHRLPPSRMVAGQPTFGGALGPCRHHDLRAVVASLPVAPRVDALARIQQAHRLSLLAPARVSTVGSHNSRLVSARCRHGCAAPSDLPRRRRAEFRPGRPTVRPHPGRLPVVQPAGAPVLVHGPLDPRGCRHMPARRPGAIPACHRDTAAVASRRRVRRHSRHECPHRRHHVGLVGRRRARRLHDVRTLLTAGDRDPSANRGRRRGIRRLRIPTRRTCARIVAHTIGGRRD